MADDPKALLNQAAEYFLATVEQVGPEQWAQPALGEWTVRDLVGHTGRALATIETYLAQPAEAVEIEGPVEYFVTALSGYGSAAQVAQRGREAGAALGADPLSALHGLVARVLELVARTDLGQLIGPPVGGMRLGGYLPTRTFELIVHTLDLAAALGLPLAPPVEPLAASLQLAAGIDAHRGRGAEPLLALTGRRSLPDGFSVL